MAKLSGVGKAEVTGRGGLLAMLRGKGNVMVEVVPDQSEHGAQFVCPPMTSYAVGCLVDLTGIGALLVMITIYGITYDIRILASYLMTYVTTCI